MEVASLAVLTERPMVQMQAASCPEAYLQVVLIQALRVACEAAAFVVASQPAPWEAAYLHSIGNTWVNVQLRCGALNGVGSGGGRSTIGSSELVSGSLLTAHVS